MIKDNKLLELAAKAVGFSFDPQHSTDTELYGCWLDAESQDMTTYWQPLTDDGDALRLANKLGIVIYTNIATAHCLLDDNTEISAAEDPTDDRDSSVRRAIVRVASQIGEGLLPFPSAKEIETLAGMDDKPEFMR